VEDGKISDELPEYGLATVAPPSAMPTYNA